MKIRQIFLLGLIFILPATLLAMEVAPEGKRALVSVSDKSDIIPLVKYLLNNGYDQIISTGGTYTHLKSNLSEQESTKIIQVSDITHFPEILGGRVKTLHPHIHGGILAKRDDESQCKELQKYAIKPIDMVVVNLYPFEETVENPKSSEKRYHRKY